MSAAKKRRLTKTQKKWAREYNESQLPLRAKKAREAEEAEVQIVRDLITHPDAFVANMRRGMWAELYLRGILNNYYHARPRARAFARVCEEIDDAAKSARTRPAPIPTTPKVTEPTS